MSFRDLVAGVGERLEIIVRFLAVLELFKQGVVDPEQAETSAIMVCRLAETVARRVEPRRLGSDVTDDIALVVEFRRRRVELDLDAALVELELDESTLPVRSR